MIKALFFDIDGTLVSFKTHQIQDSTVEALRKAKEKGLQIYIATGRPPLFINNLGRIEDVIDGYVTANGSFSYIGEEVVSVRPIPAEDVEAFVKLAEERKFCYVLVGMDEIAVFNPNEDYDRFFREMLGVRVVKEGLSPWKFMDRKILQMTPFITEDFESELMSHLPSCIIGRWIPVFADVTVAGADKGRAITELAFRQGVDISETMAFGDGGNDISMVKAAGIGVAMGNANISLKNTADYITSSVDDNGIVNALNAFGVI